MARKGSSVLVVVEPPKPRRVVGKAIETNPLIAAVAKMTPDRLADIAEEIQTTEDYLAGLKAMHHVGTVALGLAAPPEKPAISVPVAALPEAAVIGGGPVRKVVDVAEKPPPRKVVATERPATVADKSATQVVREILTENPDMSAADVVAEVKRMGLPNSAGSIRGIAYNVRSKLKDERKRDGRGAAKPPTRPEPEPDDEGENAGDAHGGLPPKDSPFRAEAELTLRKKVAEYVFKKGLVTSGEITRDCRVSPRIVNDFMDHPWFETHMQKWRLTAAGKNEGLEDF